MIFKAVALCFAAVAVLASPLPRDEPKSLEARASTCQPDTAGKKFQISLSSNAGLLANMHNCINAACTRVYLDPIPSTSTSPFVAWYAKSKGGNSVPPLELSIGTTDGGGAFCAVNPSWGSQVGGHTCIPGEVTQEYTITCENCYSPFLDLGIKCQIKSLDWGQCWESQGSGHPVVLKECKALGSPSQTFNIIEYNSKTA